MSTVAERERLGRLVGSGEEGGGLPLPSLFQALLEGVVDHDGMTTERAAEVAEGALHFKAKTVKQTWPDWEALAVDALEHLRSKGILDRNGDGFWQVGECFELGEPLEVIEKRKGSNAGVGVTVWNAVERERRNHEAHIEGQINEMLGRGVRPVQQEHVRRIREALPRVGQLYPILIDQYGRVLDGRHRKEADPHWPMKKITVENDEQALAIALLANESERLPARTRTRIAELLGESEPSTARKRKRIEAELLRDHERSPNEIAEALGVSDKTVTAVRDELEATSEIPKWRHPRSPGSRGQRAAPAGPKNRTQAEEIQRRNWIDGQSQSEIAKAMDLSNAHVQKYAGKHAKPLTPELAEAKPNRWPAAPESTAPEPAPAPADTKPNIGSDTQEPAAPCEHEWVCKHCGIDR